METALEIEVSLFGASIAFTYCLTSQIAYVPSTQQRNKLKEYEQLEIDLDDAVLQTGAIFNGGNDANDENSAPAKLNEVMTTFGAIPTSNKRRVRVSLY